ncbi:MAG: hypothetical protein LBP89_09805 [Helicobacteraceae bacterium]|jgi:Tfp pilus assembly protein PilE|nr:hypothetical protein [Helicobacteraceae bacterium]
MRRAFTLVELIVSVTLLFLLILFLASNNKTLKTSLDQAQNIEAQEKADADLLNLLVTDILQSNEINIVHGREYDVLYLNSTRNSLRGHSAANVAYATLKPSAFLLRVESSKAFKLPIANAEEIYGYHFLPIETPLNSFKIYKSQKSGDQNSSACSVLLYIAPKEKEPRLLELGLLNSTACS